MILAKSIVEARANCEHRVTPDGHETRIARFFRASAEEPDQPMAFLVDKTPFGVVKPHFHEVNQFQVIAAGCGHLGKQAVQPFSMHYTNGYTGYGPINAAENGISFYTLRNRFDPGAKYFPEGRSFMKPAPKRHRVSGQLLPSSPEVLRTRHHEAIQTVVEPEADGLAAWFLRAIPGVTTYAPDPGQGGGQYIIVAAGTLHYKGLEMPPLSCAYVSVDEDPMPLQAGTDGLEVLIMQFPVAEACPPE
jgi:hypothetical protein